MKQGQTDNGVPILTNDCAAAMYAITADGTLLYSADQYGGRQFRKH
jgi:hypothetical protein